MAGQNPAEAQVEVVNAHTHVFGDLYHQLLRAPWWVELTALAALFLLINLVFAALYLVFGGVANAHPGSFTDAFFFSVQTLGTIGYGTMYPASSAANILVAFESFAAVIVTAIATGLVFSKFSMPTARLAFSRDATIFTMDQQTTLAFRIANERGNYVVEAQVRVSIVRTEKTPEGQVLYRMHDLQLVRDRSPALGRSWTVLHRIDEKSPLKGATSASLRQDEVEVIVTILGIDGTSAQTIHGRYSYTDGHVLFGRRHADMLRELPGGKLQLDYAKFHEHIEAPLV